MAAEKSFEEILNNSLNDIPDPLIPTSLNSGEGTSTQEHQKTTMAADGSLEQLLNDLMVDAQFPFALHQQSSLRESHQRSPRSLHIQSSA